MNLGNPHEIPVKELGELVIAMTDSPSKIDYYPLPEADPKLRCPDISLAKHALGWEPRIPLEQGLAKTIAYFANLIERSQAKVLV